MPNSVKTNHAGEISTDLKAYHCCVVVRCPTRDPRQAHNAHQPPSYPPPSPSEGSERGAPRDLAVGRACSHCRVCSSSSVVPRCPSADRSARKARAMSLSRHTPSGRARSQCPWVWPDVQNKEAWDAALAQRPKYEHAIGKINEIIQAYDNGGSSKIATTRNELKAVLKDEKLAYLAKIIPDMTCPHPLNRPFEKNRMVDVASQVAQAGFDDNMCSGACVIEDVPGTGELSNPKALLVSERGLGAGKRG